MLRNVSAALAFARRVVLLVLGRTERRPQLEPDPEDESDVTGEGPPRQDATPLPPPAGSALAAPEFRVPLPEPVVRLASPSTGWPPPASHAVAGIRWYCVWRGGTCPPGIHGGHPGVCWSGIEERLPGRRYSFNAGCRLSGSLVTRSGRKRYSFDECVEAFFAEAARHRLPPPFAVLLVAMTSPTPTIGQRV